MLLCFVVLKRIKKNPCSQSWYTKLHNFGLNLYQVPCLPHKEIVFGKLTIVTFADLLCFPMRKHFKKIPRADYKTQGFITLPKFSQNCPFPRNKGILGETDCYFFLSNEPQHAKLFQKNLEVELWIITLDDFEQNWAQIAHLSQMEIFLGKLANPIAPITPQHFKKNLKTDHEIQACLILNYIWAK